MGSRRVVAESVRWRRALETQEAAECRRWWPLSTAAKGEEWSWARTSGVMVVRFSLVRATMTRSSEEMRAWRGDGGEVLVGEGDDGQVVGGDAGWEWREWWGARWRGESGEVLSF